MAGMEKRGLDRRAMLFAGLVGTHLTLYLNFSRWAFDVPSPFSTAFWVVSVFPWIIFSAIGLPVTAPLQIVVYIFPLIQPNGLGLFLCFATWLVIYWLFTTAVIKYWRQR
jgi:hypothetical protein